MTYLSPAQVADHLGVPRRRVLTAIRARQLPAVDIGTPLRPYYRVHPDDLDAWTRARQTVDTATTRTAH